LSDPEPFPVEDHEQKLREVAALLEKTFQDFGLNVKVVGIHTGPVITQYEIALETGLRLNKVTTLADDLALNLKVSSVRVVAPLPGRNTVGIEVPNEIRQTVRLKELVTATAATPKVAKFKLPIFLGKDVEGRPLAYDLADMPHLLIAGRTGTGKSVCLNTIIVSMLLTRRPDECRMILIDPKKVELSDYAQIPHLMTPVVKDEKKAEAILAWAVDKMEERYEWLHRARVRNIASYNELDYNEVVRRVNPDTEDERRAIPRRMPYIVIVIDEVADLIMRMKKEIEGNIILLAQKSRAAGIHLVLATQKPTVDVVTGLIKSNLPARICFQVASRSDSAVVLDEKGAERLLGKGDMLFLQPGTSTIVRAQGALVEDKEIERVVGAIATDTPNYDSELLNLKTRDQAEGGSGGEVGEKLRERDPLYEQAVEIVIREQRGSTSLLQRVLGIGYGKASRFIDYMAEDGIVGGYNGSNARQVLVSLDEWEGRKKAAV
jgi:S-DNA-T family DNA segregation ATPase FtsK/SpoIIIE